jgi:acetyl-CoA acetyltransferase
VDLKDKACIVGIGETRYCRKPGSGMSEEALQMAATRAALEDAGLKGRDLDGILAFPNVGRCEALAANLGCSNLRFAAIIHMGGATPVASLRLAAMAIATGQANYVLIPGGWNGYSGARVRETVSTDMHSLPGGPIAWDYYLPHGLTAPPQWYALMARRHMHEYGTRHEQLGAVAVAMRRHAQLNPGAVMCGKPLTLDDYMASPMLADPYRVNDCCLETDGGTAVIVTSPERARDLGQQPVYIMGAAAGQPYPADEITNRRDFHGTGLTIAAPEAFRMAGVTPGRRRFCADLRLLHLRGDPAARGSGFLQARRRWSLRGERRDRTRRQVACEHTRRVAVGGTFARDRTYRRSGQAVACQCR